MICQQCHSNVVDGGSFCPYCGSRFDSPVPLAKPVAPSPKIHKNKGLFIGLTAAGGAFLIIVILAALFFIQANRDILVSQKQVKGKENVEVSLTKVTKGSVVTLSLRIHNINAQLDVQPSLRGYLIDGQGVVHKPEMGGSLWVSSVPQGTTTNGTLLFSVPSNEKNLKYVQEYDYDFSFDMQAELDFTIK